MPRGVCRCHPEREAVVVCGKMRYGYCEECLSDCRACTDPDLYCRERPSCVIWEHCRKAVRKGAGKVPGA